ncbi:MAG: CapA family protein [Fluviicola sp.]|nr:CapA family protein [Fluviicola sp.]
MTHIHISKVQLLFSTLLLFFSLTVFGQQTSLIFVGDVMQHDGQIEAAYNKAFGGGYEYDDGFKFVKPIINQYDFRIANLEVTLAGKPFKGYPQFSAPDDLAVTLKNAGFNVILTSNNHSCDRGSKGVIRTLDKLDELGLAHTGTFRSKEERDANYPLIIEKKGMKIAILNYTYGTNGLSVAKPLIINYIDSAMIRKDVARAKELNADYIICNLHWGKEYRSLPDSYQKKWEAYCYKVGVDMVIGGHPHTVQPIQKKMNKNNEEQLTVWSLGNFVSNMQTRPTRGGVMVGVDLEKKEKKIRLGDVKYNLLYVLKKNEGAITQYYILPDFDYNKFRPGFIDEVNMKRKNDFFSDSRKLYKEQNIGAVESIVSENSPFGKLYRKFLTSYYAIQLKGVNPKLLSNEYMKNYLYKTVDYRGQQYILSGVFSSRLEAEMNMPFLKDCQISTEQKIVLVKNGHIEDLK